MPKYPSYKPREIEKILRENGFLPKRQSGSHKVFFHPKLEKTVVVPFHGREIPQGTIRSIIKQSSLSEKIFLKT